MPYATARLLMMVLGIAYLAFGVLGFVPGITVPAGPPGQGLLLGIFAVNAIHNVVHLVLGALMLWASMSRQSMRAWGRVLTAVFVVLAIGSFIAPLAEGLAFNVPDSGLHILTAVLVGLVGFATHWDEDVDTVPPTATA